MKAGFMCHSFLVAAPKLRLGRPVQFRISDFGIWILDARVRSRILLLLELAIVIALVTITRCANYSDVFAGNQINFVDADCYARMTRARICFEHPGTIVRRHDFENFPIGTSPHTTAPFDYLIVGTAAALRSFSKHALELAGAIVSPLLAIGLGIFLCWWTRQMRLRARTIFAPHRRIGWIAFMAIISIALTIERRIPWPPGSEVLTGLKNWSGTIGELAHVPWASPIWFQWCGWLLLLTPILFWRIRANRQWFMTVLLIATFLLTIWQARWSYFFTLLFAFIAPQILGALGNPIVASISFIIALFPIAQAWDRTFSDDERARL